MAELQIIINPTPTYADGDILLANNDADCRCIHAQRICFETQGSRLKDMDGNGIMPADHLAEDFMRATHRISIERLSKTEALMTRLSDGATVRIIDDVAYANPFAGGAIQNLVFDPFFMLRRRSQLYPVFGTVGREKVYCDPHKLYNDAVISDAVWSKIEAKTGKKHTDNAHKWIPKGDHDLRHFLVIPIPDVADDEKDDLQAESEEGRKSRKHRIFNWRRFTGVNKELKRALKHVIDPTVKIDIRGEIDPLDAVDLVQEKLTNKKRKLTKKADKAKEHKP